MTKKKKILRRHESNVNNLIIKDINKKKTPIKIPKFFNQFAGLRHQSCPFFLNEEK